MSFENWQPGGNAHTFGMLFGNVQLLGTYSDDPVNMLVCFATEKEMLRAKQAFEEKYDCHFEPEEVESFSGCHGFWMPVKIKMQDRDGSNVSIVKTGESTFLEEQMRHARVHYIHGTDIKDFHGKLTKAVNALIASRMDMLAGHTLN